jgi:hypothetical protein
MIYFLAEKNKFLKILLLVAPSRLFRKILEKTVFENLVYAIAIEDAGGNIFLFRRKANYPLVGDRELQIKMQEIAAKERTELQIHVTKINRKTTDKIGDWSVTKEDVEPLFADIEGPLALTDEEKTLIKNIREWNIPPADIEKLAKSLKSG